MSDERFAIELDASGEETIWRIGAGYAGEDKAILSRHDVSEVDLWRLICAAVAEGPDWS